MRDRHTTYAFDARAGTSERFPGVGRYARNLAAALVPEMADGERLVVIGDESVAMPSSARVVRAPLEADIFSLAHHWKVAEVLRAHRADLYHSPYFFLPLRLGAPAVVSIHDLIPFRYPDYFPAPTRAVLRVALRRAARVARAILTLSEASRADLARFLGVDAARVTVTPLAADPAFVPQSTTAIDALRARLRLPERYVLALAADRPHKNLPRLIEAWHRLQPRSEVLVIAGPASRRERSTNDPRHPATRQRTSALGLDASVHFLGRVAEADLAALYGGATLFVFPSEWEGFGLPIVEAMACGAAVACSAIAPHEEVAGTDAALFDPLEVGSIADAIRSVLDDRDRRAHLAARALERAARFSWSATARATLGVYRSPR